MAEICGEFKEHKERIAEVLKRLPRDEEVVELANFFDALGDATRVRIVLALAEGELCPCDLSRITGLSVSAVSHQLRVLKDRKIVNHRREGRNVYYKLSNEHVRRIVESALAYVRRGIK